MTEAEWRACGNPWVILQHLGTAGTDRKLRLFICACSARSLLYSLLPDVRAAVALAKQVADGQMTDASVKTRQKLIGLAEDADENGIFVLEAICGAMSSDPIRPGNAAIIADQIAEGTGFASNGWGDQERMAQCRLVREIFGYPARAMNLPERWRTDNVIALARAIYDEDDFARLPILADALEDVGCTDVDMLNHCRQPGEHVRGCWLVDLLLGKQ